MLKRNISPFVNGICQTGTPSSCLVSRNVNTKIVCSRAPSIATPKHIPKQISFSKKSLLVQKEYEEAENIPILTQGCCPKKEIYAAYSDYDTESLHSSYMDNTIVKP